MRYFAKPTQEQYESKYIPSEFGKQYQPQGSVSMVSDSIIGRVGTSLVPIKDAILAIHPDAGAWAFLTPAEADFFNSIADTPYKQLKGCKEGLPEFIARLYRRGLISINDHWAVDPTIFEDSPNFHEGHLVELLVTEKCNLACGYCLAGANPKMPAMTPEIARRTVDLAFAMTEAKVLGFEFSGGEPFLKFPLMRSLVEYIQTHPARRDRRIYLSVQSNGTLLDDERVQWLKDNNVAVGISLDGQPWSQNVSRPMLNGGESFSRLITGIDLLQHHGLNFGVLVVLNRSNVDSVQALAEFLMDNDIKSLKLNPVSYLGTARENWGQLGLSQAEVIRYFMDLIELIGMRNYPLVEANLYAMIQFLTSKQRTTRCLRAHCGAGDTFQAVSAAGDIYPCGRSTQTPALKLDNVLNPTVTSLSAPARRNLNIIQIRERRPHDLEGCNVCEYRQFCQAGCSAQAFERYGTVRHRTPECDFYKTIYPHLMYELSFNRQIFDSFNRRGYFGRDGVLINEEYGAAATVAIGAGA